MKIKYLILFLKNLQDNHTKNQEIAFYQIQKSTNHLLTKLLYKYSEQKDEIVKKHKEVLDYLEQNSYDTSLDEIYKSKKDYSRKWKLEDYE